MFEQFPYTNFHDLNLDWIIQKIKEAYSPENPPENVVVSVNGETGEVILYKNAIVALPDVESDMWNIHRGVDGSAEGIQFKKNTAMQRINGVNRYYVYDEGNPPPYPVTSVNGQTGAVLISIPVQSVNGQTGHVILYPNAQIVFPGVDSASWSMTRETDTSPSVGIRFTEDGPAKRIDDDAAYNIYDEGNPPPYPVTSVGTLTGAVAILDTTIVTDGNTQKLKITFPVTSVDGMTGIVKTWANSANAMLKTPVAGEGDAWGLVREVPSGDAGIRFEYANGELNGYLYFDDGTNPVSKVKILTPADIPSSSGVVSINGLTGVVTLNGSNLDMSGTDTRKIGTVVQALQDNFAQEYDSTSTYDKGELVIYQNQLYQCAADISTAEAWTAAHWNLVDLDILSRNKDQKISNNADEISNIEEGIAIVINGNTAAVNVSAGQYVYVKGSTITGITDGLYKAVNAIVSGTAFTSADLDNTDTASGGFNALNSNISPLYLTGNNTRISALTSGTDYSMQADEDAYYFVVANNANTTGIVLAQMYINNTLAGRNSFNASGGYYGVTVGAYVKAGATIKARAEFPTGASADFYKAK